MVALATHATAVAPGTGSGEVAPRVHPALMSRRLMRTPLTALYLVAVLAARAIADDKPAEQPAPSYAGEDVCTACHDEEAESYGKTPHARALADPARPEAMRGCEACHGPGQAHAEAGGGEGVGNLETFGAKRPASARAAVCLKCHADGKELHDFKRGDHALAALACTDCHRMHGGANEHLLAKPAPALCYGCHLDIRAKFTLPEHHKVNEGVLSCLDCHSPHGKQPLAPMRGTNNRECFRCHGDIEGPFVFEHASLVTEGCARCHDPHGSVNRHLLVRQQVAQLCYECHTVTPATHLQPSFRDCTRCHVAIHGSNVDPRFLEQ
jgi:DmsE family decaheme c-type cytochrome